MTDLHTAAKQDIPDLIAGALGVSRGTAYDLMREALAEQPAQQEPVECQYGKGGYACCEDGPCKADEQNNAPKPAQQEPVAIEHCLWARNGNTPCPHTSPQAQRKPLTEKDVKAICYVGPVYAPDGAVTRTPQQYRQELEAARLHGIRRAEAAHGITGEKK